MTTKKKYGSRDLDERLGKLTVGEFVHTWRKANGMNLKDFGELAGISVGNLCDIEKGRRLVSPERAAQFAKVMGYSAAQFIGTAIEDQLRQAGLRFSVELKAA